MNDLKRCVFCAVSAGDLPGSIPYEDDDVFALMDLHPVTPGHLMIIPKLLERTSKLVRSALARMP